MHVCNLSTQHSLLSVFRHINLGKQDPFFSHDLITPQALIGWLRIEIIMKLRFKLQDVPDVVSKDLTNSDLAFVHVTDPKQAKHKSTQRVIRRHVMKDIGAARRRGMALAHPRLYLTVPQPLPPVPQFLDDMKVCIHFQRVFLALDLFDAGALDLALASAAFDFSNTSRMGGYTWDIRALRAMKQYTASIGHLRGELVRPTTQASRNAAIGIALCLAFYDVSLLMLFFARAR
jgi:hypothetical protein